MRVGSAGFVAGAALGRAVAASRGGVSGSGGSFGGGDRCAAGELLWARMPAGLLLGMAAEALLELAPLGGVGGAALGFVAGCAPAARRTGCRAAAAAAGGARAAGRLARRVAAAVLQRRRRAVAVQVDAS